MKRAAARQPSRPCGLAWLVLMILALLPIVGSAATLSQSSSFNFAHSGAVDSGLVSVLGTFTTTSKASSPSLGFSKFDTVLGQLTGVSVTVTTTTASFAVSSTGLLSLISSATATRGLAYAITAGTSSGSGSNSVTTTGPTLITLLGVPNTEIGGAPLAVTTNFSTAPDLAQFSGNGTMAVKLTSTDVLTASTLVSLFNGAGFMGTGTYAGSVSVVYTYLPNTPVSGRVFQDDGAGSGTANDGIANGTEAGLAGRTMQLIDATNAVLATTVTGADGSYRLMVTPAVANGSVLRVQESNAAAWLSTGASAGNSSGSYSRTTDALTFTFTSGAGYAGINFGDIAPPVFNGDINQTTSPGSEVFYRHQFVASSAGQVLFVATHVSSPSISGWSETVYVDANQNGRIDSGETPASAAITVSTGQALALIVRVFVPVNAAIGMRVQGTITATVTYTNATPTLVSASTVSELTEVTKANAANLTLVLAVDKASAAPGATMVYAITFTNTGSLPITSLSIRDATPPYTTFVSAASTSIPGSLGAAIAATPTAGTAGALTWTFPGQLSPNASGIVSYTVMVNP